MRSIFRLIHKKLKNSSLRYTCPFENISKIFNYSIKEKMIKTAMLFVRNNKVKGDYLEFGVFEGETFIPAIHFAQKRNLKSMKFYAFDSFQGLPDITGEDTKGFQPFEKGQFACTQNNFLKILRKAGIDLSKVLIVPGWYNETLNSETKRKTSLKSAAIIYIDCDLYSSTVYVLDFITDYLVDGSILIFDDWFWFRGDPKRGEQRAFNEWLIKNPKINVIQFQKFGWHGNSFIINKAKNGVVPNEN